MNDLLDLNIENCNIYLLNQLSEKINWTSIQRRLTDFVESDDTKEINFSINSVWFIPPDIILSPEHYISLLSDNVVSYIKDNAIVEIIEYYSIIEYEKINNLVLFKLNFKYKLF